MDTGKKVTVEKIGHEYRTVIGWDTEMKYTEDEKKQQRAEFIREAKEGHVINLSSLMITHGL